MTVAKLSSNGPMNVANDSHLLQQQGQQGTVRKISIARRSAATGCAL